MTEPSPPAPDDRADAVLRSALLRVLGPDGAVYGAGLLIAPGLAVTCAHVVADALGVPPEDQRRPTGRLVLERPLVPGAGPAAAEVAQWVPVRADGSGDVAVLRLTVPVTGAVLPAVAAPDGFWQHPVRVPGFPGDAPDGVWHKGLLLGPTGQGWVQLTGAERQGVPVDRGFSGGPVWDDAVGAVVGIMVAAVVHGEHRQSFMIPTRTLLAEVPSLAPVLAPPSPFRGLSTYQETDAAVYFGRGAETEDLVGRLTTGAWPAVTLVGPSGSGKSSLAFAGVVPELRARGYEVLVLRPADGAPLRTALALELARAARDGGPEQAAGGSEGAVGGWEGVVGGPGHAVGGPGHAVGGPGHAVGGPEQAIGAAELRELTEALDRDGLLVTARARLGRRADRLLVVLDQAEALLTTAHGPQDAVALLFPEPHPAALRVLCTLRADLLEAALSHAELGPALSRSVIRPLLPMTRDQLAEVIRRPLADLPAVSYEPGLVARMLDDAGQEPGALPLLGFVLARLWERQRYGRLEFAAYQETGGVRGALGRHAEQAWRYGVREEEQDEALRLLTALVRRLPDSESVLATVLRRSEAGEERWRIAVRLAEQRILVLGADADGGQTVRLAHEALIVAWPTLAQQVERERDFLAWRAAVQHDLGRWQELGQAADQLLTGAVLDAAIDASTGREMELGREERQFITASLARRAAEAARARRGRALRRAGITALSVLLVVAVLASWLLYGANGRLDEDLRRAASPRMAQLAGGLDDVSLASAGLISAAALRTAETPEARTALFEQYVRMRHVEQIVVEGRGAVKQAVLTEDGTRLVTLLHSGEGLLSDLGGAVPGSASGSGPAPVPGPVKVMEAAERLAVSPDGTAFVSTNVHGRIDLGIRKAGGGWAGVVSVRTAEQALLNARPASDLRFDATGRRVLAAVEEEGVQVWEVPSGARAGGLLVPPAGWTAVQAWFGPDGTTVVGRIVRSGPYPAVRSATTGRLVRWRIADGALEQPWGEQEYGTAAVSGDGSTLVACDPDLTLHVWGLAGRPTELRQLTAARMNGPCPLNAPVLDRTGRFLVNPVQRFGTELGRYRYLVLDLQELLPAALDLPAPAQRTELAPGEGEMPSVSLAGPPGAMKLAVSAGGTVVTTTVAAPTAFDAAMLTSLVRTLNVDHDRIASVDRDGGTLRMWDLRTHRQLAAVRPSAPLARLYPTFSPGGTRLLALPAAGLDVQVWDVAPDGGLTEARTLALPVPPGIDPVQPDPRTGLRPAVTNISFDGEDHAVTTAVAYVARWDLRTGAQVGAVHRPPFQETAHVATAIGQVFGVQRPGHEQAAVATGGDEIQIWDFRTGRTVESFSSELGVPRQMGFDRSGTVFAVVTSDGVLRVRDMAAHRWRTLAHQGVRWLNGFPTGSLLSTTSTTGGFVFWDLAAGTELYRFSPGLGATGDWASDGSRFAWGEGSAVEVLELDPQVWRARACALAGRDLSEAERALLPPGGRADACADTPG
ncbi:trypsin-like peptidase domain-containing protein [Kitasatospora sp. NPDC096147]|uniref:nSTAND1 domain-containing NTPase n=1 Tax=Kitasatospora sp. NPDC096147 TaxID=3364093 RepID=UPI0038032E5D